VIVVIQCAASKRRHAGYFRAPDGRRVLFVARPELAPSTDDLIYARPDDAAWQGLSWRELVVRYNETPNRNPHGLLSAFELYENEAYRHLTKQFRTESTYILSAGWGLISAGFLTPAYDITFSSAADRYKRRKSKDEYYDLCMLPRGSNEPMVFFGGKDYVPLFSELTKSHGGPRTVFYNSAEPPEASACLLRRFEAATRTTNWHYDCVNAVLDGSLELAEPT